MAVLPSGTPPQVNMSSSTLRLAGFVAMTWNWPTGAMAKVNRDLELGYQGSGVFRSYPILGGM